MTVAKHAADLHEVVESYKETVAPAIVGHSLGAMLALAYAAAHPTMVGPIVLVCSGTFDLPSRERFSANMDKRMDAEMRRKLVRLKQLPDPNERFRALGDFTMELYSYDLATTDQEIDESEPGANSETWEDMVRLRGECVSSPAFASI
jgi:pimeloyl-ACP methyl ester carboxylesterase